MGGTHTRESFVCRKTSCNFQMQAWIGNENGNIPESKPQPTPYFLILEMAAYQAERVDFGTCH